MIVVPLIYILIAVIVIYGVSRNDYYSLAAMVGIFWLPVYIGLCERQLMIVIPLAYILIAAIVVFSVSRNEDYTVAFLVGVFWLPVYIGLWIMFREKKPKRVNDQLH